MTQPTDLAPQPPKTTWQKRQSAIGKIASAMNRSVETSGYAGFSTGDLAEFRRIDVQQPYTPALWQTLVAYQIDDDWPDQGPYRETQEERWATILMGMAFTIGLHSPTTKLGTALADAGWSETRFVRLMEARDTHLIEEIRRLSQYLSSKSQPLDWSELASLILTQEGDYATKLRRNIARDYYRQLHKLKNAD